MLVSSKVRRYLQRGGGRADRLMRDSSDGSIVKRVVGMHGLESKEAKNGMGVLDKAGLTPFYLAPPFVRGLLRSRRGSVKWPHRSHIWHRKIVFFHESADVIRKSERESAHQSLNHFQVQHLRDARQEATKGTKRTDSGGRNIDYNATE